MKRKIDIDSIIEVATALGELNQKSVFVGGSVVSLYIDDPAADELRPTMDIDIALEIVTLGQLEQTRQTLAKKGFLQDPQQNVVCRFVYQGILVDVMSTKEIGWAPANSWFRQGFEYLEKISLNENMTIQILPLAYFLASKFEAFHSRGKDPRTSHDLEDIIFLLDNRMNLVEEILSASENVISYLRSEFIALFTPEMEEAILGHMNPFSRKERYPLLCGKLQTIINVKQ
ncbi:MAG: nucleotidyl transferase AbiEii/AbiGii toxin family protein [Bacteroidales bacterium]